MPLSRLIDWSIQDGEYLAIFKTAELTPIPKTTEAKENEDFRPISMICNVLKVFELVVKNQLQDYVERHGIICPRQMVLVKNHSCETALLKVTEKWKLAMDDDKVTAVALLDLRKAFDSVCHMQLLEKIDELGANDETWA